jgi:hypothetical protein
MPDPDRDTMLALVQRIEELEEKVHQLEADHADRPDPVAYPASSRLAGASSNLRKPAPR